MCACEQIVIKGFREVIVLIWEKKLLLQWIKQVFQEGFTYLRHTDAESMTQMRITAQNVAIGQSYNQTNYCHFAIFILN